MLDIFSVLIGKRIEAHQIPDSVASITATPETGKIVVNWTYAARADHYRIARKTGSGTWVLQDGNVSGTTYEDTSVTSGTKYQYLVNAENTYGKSANKTSSQVTAL